MPEIKRYNVLGVNVSAVQYEDAVRAVMAAAREKRPFGVSALAVHGVMTGCLDAEHRRRLNRLDMLAPDGQPVRWALNWLHGANLPERVYGPELMLRLCAEAEKEQLPVFFYGSTKRNLEAMRSRLLERLPRLPIAGMRASLFRRLAEDEAGKIQRMITGSGARLVFAGLGCPRQEVWAYEMRGRISLPLIAVGAAFDFHAGTLPQAPLCLRRRGLEWVWRLWHEPRRLWKRYLLLNPLFLLMLGLQGAKLRTVYPEGKNPSEHFLYG